MYTHTQKLIDKLKEENNEPFTLLNFYGRPVFVRGLMEYEKDKTCADCELPADLAIFEVAARTNPPVWYYCGCCHIGG